MSNGKTPQTEAQTLELLNASITRETVRGAVENFLGASKEAAKQDALLLDSSQFDSVEYWTRCATKACEMLTKRSEQLREMTAERDALKAREELAQTSLRLALSGMKQANERAEFAERAVTDLRRAHERIDRELGAAMRLGAAAGAKIDDAREEAAESRRNAAVSDAGPANDVALKVTE